MSAATRRAIGLASSARCSSSPSIKTMCRQPAPGSASAGATSGGGATTGSSTAGSGGASGAGGSALVSPASARSSSVLALSSSRRIFRSVRFSFRSAAAARARNTEPSSYTVAGPRRAGRATMPSRIQLRSVRGLMSSERQSVSASSGMPSLYHIAAFRTRKAATRAAPCRFRALNPLPSRLTNVHRVLKGGPRARAIHPSALT